MRLTLRGARLVDAITELADSDITIEGDRIQAVGRPSGMAGEVVDATNLIITPGFIDVHTHGGGGYNLHTTEAEEIGAYARWAPATGVTGFLIGVVGVPDALPEQQLETAVAAIAGAADGATPLGIHLEGPYINPLRRGAHLASWLRLPDVAETERVLALTAGQLRLVTLAPELPGAAAVIRNLVREGVTVSLGHTDATYEQALEAIQLGISHATHCCNAMRPLHQRDPGPLAAIAGAPQVSSELIADGVHVHPAVLGLLVRVLGPQRAIVITDAVSAAGVTDPAVDFAGQSALVVHGAARLPDGTISGSVLTMDQALRNVLHMTGVSLRDAIRMLTLNPARAAHAANHKGRLRVGHDADLLIFDDTLTLQAAFCRGTLAFAATDVWRARLGGV